MQSVKSWCRICAVLWNINANVNYLNGLLPERIKKNTNCWQNGVVTKLKCQNLCGNVRIKKSVKRDANWEADFEFKFLQNCQNCACALDNFPYINNVARQFGCSYCKSNAG